jgi:hypothetical protein
MTQRVRTPAKIVAQVKAIIYQDKRERLAAGYRYGSRNLVKRIAEAYNLSIHTVISIKKGARQRSTWAADRFCDGLSVDHERLQQLREHNERTMPPRNTVIAKRLRHHPRLRIG